VKTSIEVLFTAQDERAFSALLKRDFPEVTFIDDDVWPTPEPPMVSSIEQCRTHYCFIWNRAIYASQRSDQPCPHGGFYGPVVATIQFLRSRPNENTLRAGRMAAGMHDEYPKAKEMVEFIKRVWKIAKKFASVRVDHVAPDDNSIITPRPPGFLVGPDAAAWCLADEHRYFKCWANTWFLRPCREQKSAEPRKARKR
jgi:hypothetical protein